MQSRSATDGGASKVLAVLAGQVESALQVAASTSFFEFRRNKTAADAWADEAVQKYVMALSARQAPGATVNQPLCYVCKVRTTETHKDFPAMCPLCGEFNLAGSNLSLPSNLSLNGKVALVTGGRINLGYHVARRVLRCGANVIISTRYPHDALTRYLAEPDADD